MTAKLYVVPASHPCATVMAALEHKGVPYERVDLVPAAHKLVQRKVFGAGTVPGIVFDDGEKVLGSRAIIRALERRVPEPALVPPEERDTFGEVRQAEEWGDQVLQQIARRLVWHALSQDHAAQLTYLEGARLVPPTPRFAARLGAGAVAWIERKVNDVDEFVVRSDLVHLPGHLGRIDRWIRNGVLNADGEPNAADLQIGASVRLLQTVDDLRALIDVRPAGEHARHWFPHYPGRVGPGAFQPAWLPERDS
jgi:glutathione S-transferase